MIEWDFKCVECNTITTITKTGQIVEHVTQDKVKCEKCGGEVTKIYLPPNISFKGSGFTRHVG